MKTAFQWRSAVNYNYVSLIDAECEEAYRLAGYQPIRSEDDLLDKSNYHLISDFNILD